MGTFFSKTVNFKGSVFGCFSFAYGGENFAITGKILEGQIQKQIFKRLKESLRRLSFRFHVTYPRFSRKKKRQGLKTPTRGRRSVSAGKSCCSFMAKHSRTDKQASHMICMPRSLSHKMKFFFKRASPTLERIFKCG